MTQKMEDLGNEEVVKKVENFLLTDETYDPCTKQESTEWVRKGSLPPTKTKMQSSAGKVMVTTFWDSFNQVYARKD